MVPIVSVHGSLIPILPTAWVIHNRPRLAEIEMSFLLNLETIVLSVVRAYKERLYWRERCAERGGLGYALFGACIGQVTSTAPS